MTSVSHSRARVCVCVCVCVCERERERERDVTRVPRSCVGCAIVNFQAVDDDVMGRGWFVCVT